MQTWIVLTILNAIQFIEHSNCSRKYMCLKIIFLRLSGYFKILTVPWQVNVCQVKSANHFSPSWGSKLGCHIQNHNYHIAIKASFYSKTVQVLINLKPQFYWTVILLRFKILVKTTQIVAEKVRVQSMRPCCRRSLIATSR